MDNFFFFSGCFQSSFVRSPYKARADNDDHQAAVYLQHSPLCFPPLIQKVLKLPKPPPHYLGWISGVCFSCRAPSEVLSVSQWGPQQAAARRAEPSWVAWGVSSNTEELIYLPRDPPPHTPSTNYKPLNPSKLRANQSHSPPGIVNTSIIRKTCELASSWLV